MTGAPPGRDRPSPPGADDFTFPSVRPDRVIDWVLVPPEWHFLSKQVLAVTCSDHRPVVAAVRMDAR